MIMAVIKIDNSKILGKIKPMHAVGQPPIGGVGKNFFTHFHYLAEAGIPYSRLHDVGGPFGGNRFVDIPNIFRDFDADENDPASYDFTFTDGLITALVEAGCKPYYRLGITIENQAAIKAYHTKPPKDFHKWARICEHIIAHYNEGWADGFRYDIEYWEIWNEPDGDTEIRGYPQMWHASAEEYFELYDITSRHLRKRFPNIKIGGYAACGIQAVFFTDEEKEKYPLQVSWLNFFYKFVEYIKEKKPPFDFFSWHGYQTAPKMLERAKWISERLSEAGYGDVEIHLNEWNPKPDSRCTGEHGAHVAAMMLGMQNTDVDMCMFYDARLQGSVYAGLFHPMTLTPTQAYYSLVAFNELYRLGNQASLEVEADTKDLYAVAATNGKKNAVLIANISGAPQELNIDGVGLLEAKYHVIDNERLLSWSPAIKVLPNNTVVLIEY